MLNIVFNPRGGLLLEELTANNIHRLLAIVIDDRILSAPTIQTRISDQAQITGNFTDMELSYLVSVLNAGPLPAPLAPQPLSEQIVPMRPKKE